MLVLSRKEGESIHIGDDIVITVVELRSDKVRLGFDAPKSVNIIRDNAIKTGANHADDHEAK